MSKFIVAHLEVSNPNHDPEGTASIVRLVPCDTAMEVFSALGVARNEALDWNIFETVKNKMEKRYLSNVTDDSGETIGWKIVAG